MLFHFLSNPVYIFACQSSFLKSLTSFLFFTALLLHHYSPSSVTIAFFRVLPCVLPLSCFKAFAYAVPIAWNAFTCKSIHSKAGSFSFFLGPLSSIINPHTHYSSLRQPVGFFLTPFNTVCKHIDLWVYLFNVSLPR